MECNGCPRKEAGFPPLCGKCSVEGHRMRGCVSVHLKCPNCKDEHAATDESYNADAVRRHRKECARYRARGAIWEPALGTSPNKQQGESLKSAGNPKQAGESPESQLGHPHATKPIRNEPSSCVADNFIEITPGCMITEQGSQIGSQVGKAACTLDNGATFMKAKLRQPAIADFFEPALDDDDLGEGMRNFDPHVDNPFCPSTPRASLPPSPENRPHDGIDSRSLTSSPAPASDDVFGNDSEKSGPFVSDTRSSLSRKSVSKVIKPVASQTISSAATPKQSLGQVPPSVWSMGSRSQPFTISPANFVAGVQNRQLRPSRASPNSSKPQLTTSLRDVLSSTSQSRRTQKPTQSLPISAKSSTSRGRKSCYMPAKKLGQSILQYSRPGEPASSLEEALEVRSRSPSINQVTICTQPVVALGDEVNFVGSMQQPQHAAFQVDQAISPIVIPDEPSSADTNAFEILLQPKTNDTEEKRKGNKRKRKDNLVLDDQGEDPKRRKQDETIKLDDIEHIIDVVNGKGRNGPPVVKVKLKKVFARAARL